MKIAIAYPPLIDPRGVPLLSQNRQLEWCGDPTYIYPIVPAYAATLLQDAGHSPIWLDGIASNQSYEDWLDNFRKADPDIVIMETKTPVIKKHWKIISNLKAQNPKLKTVLCGDHVTAMPEESFKESEVDFVISGGDYDFLLLSLVNHLSKNEPLKPGIWFKSQNTIKSSGKFNGDNDLNTLPFIDRELSQWRLYSEKNGNFEKTPGTYIMSGRDCWHHQCTFCSWTTLYPTYRTRSPENVINEIGLLIKEHGVKEIMDDTGSFPIGTWLDTFCQLMREKGYHNDVTLDCNMRFSALTSDQYRMMKRSGFRLLLFGLESGNQQTLDRLKKNVKVEDIVSSCRKAKEAGLEPHITLMFGYPWETRADAMKTLQLGSFLLKKGYADTVQATIIIPYPGTPLFNEAKDQGWLNTLDWDRYGMDELVLNSSVGKEEVAQIIAEIYKIGFNPEFLIRKIIRIRNLSDIKYMARAGKKLLGHIRDYSKKSQT